MTPEDRFSDLMRQGFMRAVHKSVKAPKAHKEPATPAESERMARLYDAIAAERGVK